MWLLSRLWNGTKYKGVFPDLCGKTAIVTGGNKGIGRATAQEFARLGCHVTIGARDRAKGQQAVKQIIAKTKNNNVEFIPLDLGRRSSIENFAKSLKQEKVDFLINNAGVMGFPKFSLTEDGFEMHYGINHLGHFLLTYLLWDKLLNSNHFRIVNVAAHAQLLSLKDFTVPRLDFNDMNFQKGDYNRWVAYSRSKLYNVMFATSLAEKIPKGKGIASSLHPGSVLSDGAFDVLDRYRLGSIVKILGKPILRNTWEGSQTTFHCCFSDEVVNGQYYCDCRISKKNDQVNPENLRKLWKISEQAWNIKF